LAEGARLDFVRFLRYSLASTSELEYHLMVAHEIGVLERTNFIPLVAQLKQVRMMLYGLVKRLETSITSQRTSKG
jgi:four helix bundle protein